MHRQPRKVSMEMRAIAIGQVTKPLLVQELGAAALYAGFITSSRNKRGLLFHITSVEPQQGSPGDPDRQTFQ